LPLLRLPRPLPQAKDNFREGSFEAIAWYQPFHRYEEVAWGIYYNSDKLDVFAAGLAQDLRSTEPRAHDLAAQLAMRLTAAHELFHARVEFAAAWLELGVRRPRYLRYNEYVYTKLRSTSDWLEEALANWTAFDWLRKNISNLQSLGLVTNPDRVFAIIQDWLDFSPPGYSDWRLGDGHFAWQRLTSELATALPHPSIAKPLSLPLEGLIRTENICDLRIEDVPKYFIGRGVLADIFFSTPSRREVIRVLRHFDYQPLPDRGKGSRRTAVYGPVRTVVWADDQWKAAAFARWHEPDESRGSRPESRTVASAGQSGVPCAVPRPAERDGVPQLARPFRLDQKTVHAGNPRADLKLAYPKRFKQLADGCDPRH
jgi:hypothetical protein